VDSVAKRFGESRYLSLITGGSFTQAAFGGESAGGEGTPVFEVCQSIPSGSIALVAVHPAGRAGGVTPSKFWFKIVISSLKHCGGVGVPGGVGVGVGVAVAVAEGVGVGVGLRVGVTVGVGEAPCPYLIVRKSPSLVPVT
jgi:hypothetical protein